MAASIKFWLQSLPQSLKLDSVNTNTAAISSLEIWIDWLSWIILFGFQRIFGVSTNSDPDRAQNSSFFSSRSALWLTAAPTVGAEILSSQALPPWLSPIVTVIVTLVVSFFPVFGDSTEYSKVEESAYSEDTGDDSGPINNKETIPNLPILLALNLGCFVLMFLNDSNGNNSVLLFASLLFLITRSASMVFISKFSRNSPGQAGSNSSDTLQCIEVLSMPILALLTLALVVIRPDIDMSAVAVLGHAIVQAVWWFATIHLLRSQFLNTAANADTVSQAIQMAFARTNLTAIATAILALVIAVVQSVLVVNPGQTTKRALGVLAMVFILALYIHQDPRLVPGVPQSGHEFQGHPIEAIVSTNRAYLEKLMAKQSQTIDEARREYQRRYHRQPPLGFDAWFNLAQENDFVLIDEFDTFMSSIEPFFGVHPSIIQHRIETVLKLEPGRVSEINFANQNVTMSEGITGLFKKVMPNLEWVKLIPYNMTVLVNEWDESMVSATYDEVAKAVKDAKDPLFNAANKDLLYSPLHFIETGKQDGWAATFQACSIDSPSRQFTCPEQTLSSPLHFISNASSSMDVCENCEIMTDHGLLVSPGNLKVMHDLTPIWSASKPSHFNDILYPSAFYIGARNDYRPELDSHWSQKDNKFYWTGSSTGGWSTMETWALMHRQRLVTKTNNHTELVQLLEETSPGSNKWQPRISTMGEVAKIFSTRITNIVQCSDDACEAQKKAFGIDEFTKGDSQEAAYSHKFALDLDGNGFSGRYYRLLRSRSVVVKQTILKEWHDDRLIPWVHYVPLSTSYAELPELARFLATTEQGERISERIARESTEWHDKVLRDIDLQLVWLRAMLEFGRVMNPDMHE